MKIHKEGYSTIILSFVILFTGATLIHFLLPAHLLIKYSIYAIFGILLGLIIFFFRSPEREMTLSHKYALAPADGKIVVIEEVIENEYLNDMRLQVSIFMSPLNVHSNRYPCSGVVKYFKYHPGSYIVAWHPKSSEANERTTIVVESKNEQLILLRQIAGAMARRIVCNAEVGQTIKQGEELGFIKFGSRVDILLPLGSQIKVHLGQNVKAGQTVIAEFI